MIASASLAESDLRRFDHLDSQTTPADRRSLLALWSAAGRVGGTYSYLEVGSYLGGSLQVQVADPACAAIISIDARPARAIDVRGAWQYPQNSTALMRERLSGVPGADLSKLQTIDADTGSLDPHRVTPTPTLSFIDAEHTPAGALADARFARAAMRDAGAVIFHDRGLVYAGICSFLGDLAGRAVSCYPLPDSLLVIELGGASLAPLVLGADHVPRRDRRFAAVVGRRPGIARSLLELQRRRMAGRSRPGPRLRSPLS